MDEWEIRNNERQRVKQELIYEYLNHENEKDWKMNPLVIDSVIKKGVRCYPKRVDYLTMIPYNNKYEREVFGDFMRKINELVESVNEINMRFGNCEK